MALGAEPDRLLEVLRNTIIGMVRREGRDLSARQFAVMMLISDLEGGSHTVRELALRLNVPKPSITRGIDRLVELGLARRAPDPRDRRTSGRRREPATMSAGRYSAWGQQPAHSGPPSRRVQLNRLCETLELVLAGDATGKFLPHAVSDCPGDQDLPRRGS